MPARKARPARKSAKRPAKAARKTAKKPAKNAARKPPAERMAKAEGDAPVQAYIEALPAWQRELASRFDGIVEKEVPDVRKAIKWGAPFYGVPGRGWFASVGGFRQHVKFNFFRGTALKPVPPAGGSAQMRALDVREDDEFPEFQLTEWVRQAARLPGWGS